MAGISPVKASSMAESTLVFPAPFGPCTKMTGALSGTVMVPLMLRKFEIDMLLSEGLMTRNPRRRGRGELLKLGLREVVWVFLATSERWKHACEHLEPQIFLVA